jgi:predicted Zn-dependent protease
MMQMAGEAAAADAELTAASQTIDRIIDRWPGYARAHLVLAMLHFGIDEPERARAELEVARKLEPTTASLAAAWAQYYLSQGDDAAAIVQAKKAVKLNPEDWQLRLQIARVLVEAGDDQAAQVQVQAALALVPSSKRDELEQYLARALGREPFGDQRSPTTSAPGDLVLPKPSIGDAPSASVPAPGDPSLMLGDPSDLRLRDPDQRLRLDLDD